MQSPLPRCGRVGGWKPEFYRLEDEELTERLAPNALPALPHAGENSGTFPSGSMMRNKKRPAENVLIEFSTALRFPFREMQRRL
jgi:hypothetical protein